MSGTPRFWFLPRCRLSQIWGPQYPSRKEGGSVDPNPFGDPNPPLRCAEGVFGFRTPSSESELPLRIPQKFATACMFARMDHFWATVEALLHFPILALEKYTGCANKLLGLRVCGAKCMRFASKNHAFCNH